jgi:hypothetical protein
MEKRFVRTSTLATFVDVMILPDHVSPRSTSGAENRIAAMRGAASPAVTGGVGNAPAPSKVTFEGTATPCEAQPARTQAKSAATIRRDIAS